MQASFVLDSDELDYNFIDKLKVLFQNKRIELTISESDDTEYLLGSNTNKDIFLISFVFPDIYGMTYRVDKYLSIRYKWIELKITNKYHYR